MIKRRRTGIGLPEDATDEECDIKERQIDEQKVLDNMEKLRRDMDRITQNMNRYKDDKNNMSFKIAQKSYDNVKKHYDDERNKLQRSQSRLEFVKVLNTRLENKELPMNQDIIELIMEQYKKKYGSKTKRKKTKRRKGKKLTKRR